MRNEEEIKNKIKVYQKYKVIPYFTCFYLLYNKKGERRKEKVGRRRRTINEDDYFPSPPAPTAV